MRPLLFSLLLIFPAGIMAQQNNLVVNPSFEELDGKIKEGGAIEVATGWKSPTGVKADLFSPDSKADEFLVPDNKYGREKAMDGNNYAGLVAFADKGKSPRSYISGELKTELEADKEYCVTFYVSLSDLAKYAINTIGVVLHKDPFKMEGVEENILIQPHVVRPGDRTVDRTLYWQDICGVYKAKGSEKYITLGNFTNERDVEDDKMKKADEFRLQRQIPISYYFVDHISVVPMDESTDCDCVDEGFVDKPKVVRVTQESNVTTEDMMSQIENTFVQFAEYRAALSEEAKANADKIVEYLKLDSDLKVQINGHCSEKEFRESKRKPALRALGVNRARAVFDYMVSKEADRKRISMKPVMFQDPIGDKEDEDFDRKNQAVSFTAIEKTGFEVQK